MKYIIEFCKKGTICYTSHLDIIKVFKRAFKKAGIRLVYSQGFNPHPKMGCAQPLSLGYKGMAEYMEFETPGGDETDGESILEALIEIMPEGLELNRIIAADWLKKTLAAETIAAEYLIDVPVKKLPTDCTGSAMSGEAMWNSYMNRPEIFAWKKQKKKPEPVRINIRPKIRELTFTPTKEEAFERIIVDALLDSGSNSNLSPELVITTIAEHFNLDADRAEIDVTRKKILFSDGVQKEITARR